MFASALPTRPPWVLLLSLGLLAVTAVDARAGDPLLSTSPSQSLPDSVRQAALRDFHGPDMEGKDGPLSKAGLDLLLLYHQYRSRSDRSPSIQSDDEPPGASQGGLQIQNGRVVVDAIAAGDVAALAADLDSLGMTDVATAGGLVSGRFPVAKIPALARLATLRGVQPARARTRSGRSAEPAAPTRPSRPPPEERPAPAPDSASSGEPAAPSGGPPPDEPSADDEPAPAADTSSDAPPSPPALEAPSFPEETVSSPPHPEDASTAFWGVIALMAVVLFLEEP